MATSYHYNIEYEITCCDAHDYPDLSETLTDYELKQLLKNHRSLLKQALNDLSTNFMFGGEKMDPGTYKKHLEKCLIKGAVGAKIKYYLSGYAKCIFTFDHELSEEEKELLDEAIEAQMVDGYGESPLYLFGNDDFKYYLTI